VGGVSLDKGLRTFVCVSVSRENKRDQTLKQRIWASRLEERMLVSRLEASYD
jgi:hypothetical protein